MPITQPVHNIVRTLRRENNRAFANLVCDCGFLNEAIVYAGNAYDMEARVQAVLDAHRQAAVLAVLGLEFRLLQP